MNGSPVQALPQELLSDIFLLSLSKSSMIPVSRRNGNRTPLDVLALCQVCSDWRQVALQTHEMWNDLRIELSYVSQALTHVVEGVFDMATAWLSRAGPMVLDVHIRGGTFKQRYRDLKQPLLQFLSHHVNRFRTLHLELHDASTIAPLISQIHAPLWSSLRTLSIQDRIVGVRNPGDAYLWEPIAAFNSAGTLRKVIFTSLMGRQERGPPINRKLLELPMWSRLTEINVALPFSADACYALFSRCESLEICTLGVHACGMRKFDWMSSLPEIVLPRLRILNLRILRHGGELLQDYAPAIRHLTVPMLEEFTFEYMGAFEAIFWNGAVFKEISIRSSYKLKKLSLNCIVISASQLEDSLSHCPFLVELNLHDSARPHPTIDAGFYGLIGFGGLLSRLEKMTLEVSTEVLPAVLDMIEERQKNSPPHLTSPFHSTPLKKVNLFLDASKDSDGTLHVKNSSPTIDARLRHLESIGLCHINYRPRMQND